MTAEKVFMYLFIGALIAMFTFETLWILKDQEYRKYKALYQCVQFECQIRGFSEPRNDRWIFTTNLTGMKLDLPSEYPLILGQ